MGRIISFVQGVRRGRKGVPTLPRFLTHTLTFSCNARCVMCDSWKKPSSGDLSLGEIRRIYSQLPEMDAVRLTGGEPFLRPDLLEIAGLAVHNLRPLALHVTTNGLLTDQIIAFCERRPRTTPLHVLVSVDGMEEKHDRTRGRAGAWSRATRTIRELAPRSELNIRLAVNQTILDAEGLGHYERLRDYLKPHGVRVNVVMAYDASATYSPEEEAVLVAPSFGGFIGAHGMDPERVERFISVIRADLREASFLERLGKQYYMRGLENRVMKGSSVPNPRCVALNSHMRILPDGSVPTCQFNTLRIGNLRDQAFDAVWFGDRAEQQRAWVRKCPGCWAECEVLPNAVYSGDIVAQWFRRNRPVRRAAGQR